MEVQRRKCKHRPRRNAQRAVWLCKGGMVVKVVGSGMCIYNSMGRRYPIFGRLSPAHASTSEKNGLVEAGGDLEDWRADHRVLVQQGQTAGSTTNCRAAPSIRPNHRRPRRRGLRGQLADGGGWAVGREWRVTRAGVVGPTRVVDPSMQGASPPSCGARGHRPLFAARGRRSAREVRSAK